MGVIESLPVRRVSPSFFVPFWLSTARDIVNGINPTVTGDWWWNKRGQADNLMGRGVAATSISYAHNAAQALTHGTLILHGLNRSPFSNQTFFRKTGAGNRYQFYTSNGNNIVLFDGTSSSALVTDLTNTMSVAVTWTDGNIPNFYADGSLLGVGSLAVNTGGGTSDLVILNNTQLASEIGAVYAAGYQDVLTADEILAMFDWGESLVTPRKQWPGNGLRYPDRETNLAPDGDMEQSGVGVFGSSNNPDLSKVAGSPNGKGSQVLQVGYIDTNNPAATLPAIFTVGRQYLVTVDAKGDGTWAPRVLDASGGISMTGTAVDEWQQLSSLAMAQHATLLMRANATGPGNVQFDNLKVWTRPAGYTPRTGDPLFLDNIQTARVTLANETSGQLSNTGYHIESGTWAVTEDPATGERYIECIVAGIISRRNLYAYGTWEFCVLKAGAANVMKSGFVSSVAASGTDPAQNGYALWLSGVERIVLTESSAGVESDKFRTATEYIQIGVKYLIRITRSSDDEFSTYIKGGVFFDWTLAVAALGTNPIVDPTTIDSLYSIHDFDAGDRIYLDRQTAGVASPI